VNEVELFTERQQFITTTSKKYADRRGDFTMFVRAIYWNIAAAVRLKATY
jgi:hypothetical protein